MVFRHGLGAGAHPFDRPFPAVVPGDGDTLRHGGHDFQLVAGFQAEVLDQCLGQPHLPAYPTCRSLPASRVGSRAIAAPFSRSARRTS